MSSSATASPAARAASSTAVKASGSPLIANSRSAGGKAEILVINNLTPEKITESIKKASEIISRSQMIVLPGGFSGGDEPDGSAKFITAFFRIPAMKDAVHELLKNRDGLMLGICNGFQALVKLGLVPFGEIVDTDDQCPTLTFNEIGRHQSMLVRTRIASNKSPWLSRTNVDDIHTIAISHGEGRFVGPEKLLRELAANGQIATQYVDLSGNASMDMRFNPNASYFAIEASPAPTAAAWARWAIPSAPARTCTRTSLVTSTSPCSRAAWITSSNHCSKQKQRPDSAMESGRFCMPLISFVPA